MAGNAREECPRCGMLMIVVAGFGKERNEQTQECLRCGHLDAPGELSDHTQPTLAERSRRFRDKAAEAQQMIDAAKTQSRRETLAHRQRILGNSEPTRPACQGKPSRSSEATLSVLVP
jgi:hypothetical protein